MQVFDAITLGNVLILGSFVVAYATYLLDRKKDREDREKAREKMLSEQTVMHLENKQRLDILMEFQKEQLNVNKKRDEQITLLSSQNSALIQMANGMERRVQMLEDRDRF